MHLQLRFISFNLGNGVVLYEYVTTFLNLFPSFDGYPGDMQYFTSMCKGTYENSWTNTFFFTNYIFYFFKVGTLR